MCRSTAGIQLQIWNALQVQWTLSKISHKTQSASLPDRSTSISKPFGRQRTCTDSQESRQSCYMPKVAACIYKERSNAHTTQMVCMQKKEFRYYTLAEAIMHHSSKSQQNGNAQLALSNKPVSSSNTKLPSSSLVERAHAACALALGRDKV